MFSNHFNIFVIYRTMILKHTQYSWLQYVITSSLCFHLGTLNAKIKNADVGFFDLEERFLSIKTILRVLRETKTVRN